MEQLNNNVIGEFFEKLGILEENDRDEFFKKIDEKHKVNLTQDLDLAVALRKDKGNGKIYTVNEITEKVTNQNNLVSKKRLGENPVFRTRRAGDRFTYPDRMVTKPLRKVFNEQKIPSEMRDRLLLLAVSNTVLWCEKLGVSLQGKADDTEKTEKLLINIDKEG